MPNSGCEPREIVVISGKGGTGKTSLTASFAALARNAVFCDLDVDVPDLHIILQPSPQRSEVFMGGNKASIQESKCAGCGTCASICHFGAIICDDGAFKVDADLCEGCGVCVEMCPEHCIDFPEALCGEWHISDTRFGPLVHASLLPGQENSGRLISILKREARDLAKERGYSLILCDGSPGIGCPVVSSLAGASLAVAVVEPSISGLHDFERVAGVCRHFRLPIGVVINRWDINPEGTDAIKKACAQAGHTIFGCVPYDAEMVRATSLGLAAAERPSPLAETIRCIWNSITAFQPPAQNASKPFIPAAKPSSL